MLACVVDGKGRPVEARGAPRVCRAVFCIDLADADAAHDLCLRDSRRHVERDPLAARLVGREVAHVDGRVDLVALRCLGLLHGHGAERQIGASAKLVQLVSTHLVTFNQQRHAVFVGREGPSALGCGGIVAVQVVFGIEALVVGHGDLGALERHVALRRIGAGLAVHLLHHHGLGVALGLLEDLAPVLLVDARRLARLHLDAVHGLVKGVSAARLSLMHPIRSLVERARHSMAHLVGTKRVDKLGERLVGVDTVDRPLQRVAGVSVGHKRIGRRLEELDGTCGGRVLHMKHALGDARVHCRAVLVGRPGCGAPRAGLCIPHRPAPVGVAVKANRLTRLETVGRLQLEESVARLFRGVLKRDGRRALHGGDRAIVDGPVGGAIGARKPPGHLLGKLGPDARRRVVGLFLAHS